MSTTRLYTEAEAITPRALREEVLHLLESARANADETVMVEKAAPESEWASIFHGTLRDALCNEQAEGVAEWFAERGIRG